MVRYSMGIVNIDNVLMILGASRNMDPMTREIVTKEFIRGFYGQFLSVSYLFHNS